MTNKNNISTREKILQTATRLFHEQGFNETGINQIIKEAEVAKASLYYHFPTKEDLCVAYLNERHKTWTNDFNAFIKNKENKIIAAFDALIEDNEIHNFRGCSFINMLSQTDAKNSQVLKLLQNHKLALQQFFKNELKVNNPELAYQIYSLFENAIIESQLFKSQAPVKRIQSIVTSLLNNANIQVN